MRRHRIIVALVACAAACGLTDCKKRPPDTTPVEDPWAEARAEMTEGGRCFEGLKQYCLTDPAFLDPIIQEVLDKRHDGEMPTTRDGVKALLRHVGSPYRQALKEPAAVLAVQALIQARFDAPVVTVEGDTAIADYGHVAGTLRVSAREGVNMKPASKAEGPRWGSEKVGQALRKLAQDHPTAAFLEARVMLPKGTGRPHTWRYRYKLASKKLRVEDTKGSSYHLGAMELAEIGAGASVATRDLNTCSKNAKGDTRRPACSW